MGKLDKLRKTWNKMKALSKEKTRSGYDEIEDGVFLARIMKAEFTESQTSGRPQVNWTFILLEGQFEGKKKMDFQGMEDENKGSYVLARLAQLGYPDVDLDDFESTLKEITKKSPICRIKLKTKGEYQNVFLEKVLNREEIEAKEGEEGSEEISGEEEEETEEETEAAELPEGEETEEETETEDVPEEPVEEQVELEIGMFVSGHTNKGTMVKGTVVKILEDEGMIKVKNEKGIWSVIMDDSLAVEEAQVEKKKPVPAPAEKKISKAVSSIKRKK